MTTYPIDPAVSGPGSFMVEINPDAGTARLVPMAEVQRLRDADVDQHVILPDVQRENERLREELNTVRSGGAVPRKPPYDRLYINWQRATEDAAMGWAENARNVERNVELFEVIRAVEAALCKEEQAVLKVAKAQQVIIDAGLATEPVGKDAPCGNRGPRIGSDVAFCVLRRGHDGDHHAHESFGPCTGWRS